jgi:hypothetical protein
MMQRPIRHIARTIRWWKWTTIVFCCLMAVETVLMVAGRGYMINLSYDSPGGVALQVNPVESYRFGAFWCFEVALGDYNRSRRVSQGWRDVSIFPFFGGFRMVEATPDTPAVFTVLFADFLLVLIFGLGAKFSSRKWDRLSSVQRTICSVCGYDLRAHQPGQKCPECGTEIAPDRHEGPDRLLLWIRSRMFLWLIISVILFAALRTTWTLI